MNAGFMKNYLSLFLRDGLAFPLVPKAMTPPVTLSRNRPLPKTQN